MACAQARAETGRGMIEDRLYFSLSLSGAAAALTTVVGLILLALWLSDWRVRRAFACGRCQAGRESYLRGRKDERAKLRDVVGRPTYRSQPDGRN